MSELKIFSKRRIANVVAGAVVVWCMYLWSTIILAVINNTFVDITHKELLLTMIGVLSGIAGFCLRHLYDLCGDD